MEIEQLPPNGPNFLLIVGLFCVTILVIFALALFFVDFDGGHIHMRHHTSHPTSQLQPFQQHPSPPSVLASATL